MSPLTWIQKLVRRSALAKSALFHTFDLAVRGLLWPFQLPRPAPAAETAAPHADAIGAYNLAAEEYYATIAAPDYLLSKPFSDAPMFAKRLVDLGVLIDGLRLRPGHVVLELGAGSCWLSHFLNLYGCSTISVDVSATALELGRRLFRDDPRTNWALNPQFVPYDGYTVPLDAESVDAVILYDSYHHLPNPDHLLREIRRVIRAHGVVAMSEPGRGHTRSMSATLESESTGVLERELSLEDIGDAAERAGFRSRAVIIATRAPVLEVDIADLRRFMGGKGFREYWRGLCASLDGHHYIVLRPSSGAPTTARPHRLVAHITAEQPGPIRATTGSPVPLTLRARNIGDTVWLHGADGAGWTRLGAHLFKDGVLVDFDWLRNALPHDVPPGSEVCVTTRLPALQAAGRYLVVFDFVVEGVTWFSDQDSQPLKINLEIVVEGQQS